MRFFFDNCFSVNVVKALRCLDERHELVHSQEKFPADVTDPVWIASLGSDGGWIIVSADPRISRGTAEKKAWIESGLTAFFCGDAWAGKRVLQQASQFLGWWGDIVHLAASAKPGSGYLMEFKSKYPRQIYPTVQRKK